VNKGIVLFYLFICLVVVGLGFVLAKQVLCCMNHSNSPFCSGYFGVGVSRTICPGWPQTMILPISASQVARITDVSHQHPAYFIFN
jgi:hypothetical protein